jgi:pimeloyl-ACP methyl ester carboxylesterase
LNCHNARENLYHELPEPEKDGWMEKLKPQPAADWDRVLNYCGWMEVPSVYLVCEADRLLPAELQLQLAGIAGSEILRCKSGHMVQLSMPEKVVEVVNGILDGL